MNHKKPYVFVILFCVYFLVSGCRGPVPSDRPHAGGKYIEDAQANESDAYKYFKPASEDHFYEIDGKIHNGKYTPLSDLPEKHPNKLAEIDIRGRQAWMLWTGGNERFWDWLSRNGYDTVDFLKVIDSDRRGDRFARAGLIPEPGMRAPTDAETKDWHGIRVDRPKDDYYAKNPYSSTQPDPDVYGYPTGIVGMRIFKNPEFEKSASAKRNWDPAKFYEDQEYSSNPKTIKPFIVGISCAICHASYHPLNPPIDVEDPEWSNISSTIGAQYLRIREVFGNTLEPKSYLYHLLDSQFPGTIDTSLVATDHINNPNTMNAIFGLQARIRRALDNPPETLSDESFGPPGDRYPGLWDSRYQYGQYDYPPPFLDHRDEFEGNPRHVPMVLVDGSDSVGSWVALARVYLNIGTYHDQWMRTHNTALGFRDQTPFRLEDCEENSIYWHATKIRVDSMTAYFLKSSDPMLLKDALVNNKPVVKFAPTKSVIDYREKLKKEKNVDHQFTGLPTDESLKNGRQVFAKGCIACHSSKQPVKNGLKDALVVLDEQGNEIKAEPLDMDDLWRLTRGDGQLPADYARWAQAAVENPEFWEDNYLSTDRRIPVTITETNASRAMATNAKRGHVWEDFASNTYKDLDSVGAIRYRDPFSGAENRFEAPAGGPGYYRVPTLISAWATAPFLHNNSLGNFNNDPSVKGRLEAYDDAIRKLLNPGKRFESHDLAKLNKAESIGSDQLEKDGGLIWRTDQRTHFKIRGHQVPSFLAGFTGFRPIWIRLIPWVPSLVFVFIAVRLALSSRIKRIGDWLVEKHERFRLLVMLVKLIGCILLVLLAFAFGFVLWKYFSAFRMIEVGSGWLLPWINLHILTLVIVFAVSAIALWFQNIRVSKMVAVVFLAAAIVFAAGFGRFASGNGSELTIGPFPQGMPVNLLVNVDPHSDIKDLVDVADALVEHFKKYGGRDDVDVQQELHDFERNVAPLLMKVSNCPDLVVDRGHDYEFMQQLSDEEKEDLILLIKTF